MKKIIAFIMLMFISLSVYANDIYITQSGSNLDLDVTQDGQNNTVGNSTTSSSVAGATTNLAITQVGNSNVLTFDVNGATYTEIYNDIFLKKYTTALFKKQWGQNLIKFEGMQLPGGATLNGRQIYDDGNTELERLDEELQLKYQSPDNFYVG